MKDSEKNEKNTVSAKNENAPAESGTGGVFLDSLASFSTTEIAPKLPKKLPPISSYMIKTVVMIVLIAIMLLCVSEVVESMRGYKEAGDIYDDLSGIMGDILSKTDPAVSKSDKNFHGGTTENFGTPTIPEINEGPSDDTVSETLILLRAKLKSLRETNPDVIGWISIPGTVIDYPIVQTEDNDYYLDHSITGTYLKSGSIFADYRNASDWSDQNTVLYGHNMASGEMFAALAKFKSGSFFRANRYIYIYTDEGIRVYTVFSAYETNTYNPYTRMHFASDNEFVEWAKKAYKSSLKAVYDYTFKFKGSDRILTLSTCTNGFNEDGRLAVHAVLTEIRN
ncbi:MAG: class B sortase [Ruminococcaceae bacterium]|nr:class B sortase [Oscillospiraceae bacterium]